MKCNHCGFELDEGAKFCPYCGEKVELVLNEPVEQRNDGEVAKKPIESNKEDISKTTETNGEEARAKETDVKYEFWPKFTSDEYRNEIIKSLRISNIANIYLVIVSIAVAGNYIDYLGWGWTIAAFFINSIVLSLVMAVIGNEKYFGEGRLEKYDRLVTDAGKAVAIATMEGRKPGIIRKILYVLVLLFAFAIADTTTTIVTELVLESRVEEDYDSSLTEKTITDVMPEATTEAIQSLNFQVGESVSTDLFEFVVTNAYVLDYLDENKKVPEGAVYVAVEYEYKNISKQPISSWDLPTVGLADGNDAVYAQDADADWYFDGYSDEKLLSDMNPGIKTKGARIFEVAIDVLNAGGMRAYVKADKNFYVDLPLSYDNTSDSSYEEDYLGSEKADGYSEDVPHTEYSNEIVPGYYIEPNNEIRLSISMYSSPEDEILGSIEYDYGFGYDSYMILDNGSDIYILLDSFANVCGTIWVIDSETIGMELFGEFKEFTCVEVYSS